MDAGAACIGQGDRHHHEQHAGAYVDEKHVRVEPRHIAYRCFYDQAAKERDHGIKKMPAPEQREERRNAAMAEVAQPYRIGGAAYDGLKLRKRGPDFRRFRTYPAAEGIQSVQFIQVVCGSLYAYGFRVIALAVMDAHDDAGRYGEYLCLLISVSREHAVGRFLHAVYLRAVADQLPPQFAAKIQA